MASGLWSERGLKLRTDNKERPEFDQYASSYTELLDDPLRNQFARDPIHFHRRKWILIQRLLRSAGVTPAKLRWLDVGCGRGELLELAGSSFLQATGCDPSAGMLSSDASVKTYKQTSLVELPFEGGSFDFVTAVCVLHHVHGGDRSLLAEELRRVLSPRGLCCIIEHNPWNPVTRTIVKRCPVDVDAELLTAGEASRLLRASSFRMIDRKYFLYLPERLFHTFGAVERVLSRLPFGGQYALLAQAPSKRWAGLAEATSSPLEL
jgi:SAM-dependent methyltransferase